MATFTNLYHASEVIKSFLETRITPAPKVVVGPPPEASSTIEELRVSLLWINEQPTHKSDGFVRNPDGTSAPPPATLSLFVLITGYGQDTDQNAEGAQRLIGEVIRTFHAVPIVELPLPALPNNSGRGKLTLALVPLTPEIMEKLFSPLQIKHRPFLLYELGPVQLLSRVAAGPVAPVVAPGGVRLVGPVVATPPVITRVVPHTLAVGGYLRIDGVFASPIDTVWIGTRKFVAPNDFDIIDAGSSVGLFLPKIVPNTVSPGVHRVSVVSGTLAAEPTDVRVSPAGTRCVDGPKILSAGSGSLFTLTGQGLAAASAVYIWPDSGIHDPSDVIKVLSGLAVTPTSVEFTVPSVSPGQYRVAVELKLGLGVPLQFTPFVNLEISP